MSYNKRQMTKNDKNIIDKNPGVSPYDLLTKHNLSQAAYDELLKSNDEKDKQVIENQKAANNLLIPDEVKATTKHRIEPSTSNLPVQSRHDSATVMVHNKHSGKRFKLSEYAATRLVRKFPSEYEISK